MQSCRSRINESRTFLGFVVVILVVQVNSEEHKLAAISEQVIVTGVHTIFHPPVNAFGFYRALRPTNEKQTQANSAPRETTVLTALTLTNNV